MLLGARQECKACHNIVVATTPEGTRIPVTGYEISFRDFENLLTDSDYRASISPLLANWFGYVIKSGGECFKIFAPDGNEVDPVELHQRIQANSKHQYQLYQAAMSLWR